MECNSGQVKLCYEQTAEERKQREKAAWAKPREKRTLPRRVRNEITPPGGSDFSQLELACSHSPDEGKEEGMSERQELLAEFGRYPSSNQSFILLTSSRLSLHQHLEYEGPCRTPETLNNSGPWMVKMDSFAVWTRSCSSQPNYIPSGPGLTRSTSTGVLKLSANPIRREHDG
jgi:hypothetical protein